MATKSKKIAEIIKRDIDNRVTEKFQDWINDSLELYAIADIPYDGGMRHLLYLMLSATVSALISKHAKKADVLEVMATAYDQVLPQYKEHQNDQRRASS